MEYYKYQRRLHCLHQSLYLSTIQCCCRLSMRKLLPLRHRQEEQSWISFEKMMASIVFHLCRRGWCVMRSERNIRVHSRIQHTWSNPLLHSVWWTRKKWNLRRLDELWTLANKSKDIPWLSFFARRRIVCCVEPRGWYRREPMGAKRRYQRVWIDALQQ